MKHSSSNFKLLLAVLSSLCVGSSMGISTVKLTGAERERALTQSSKSINTDA